MDKSELSERERELIADIGEFNKTQGTKGWDLRNKQFADVALKGIKLFNSTWENVGLDNIDVSHCEIRNTVLRRVSCDGTDFSGSRMEKVKFESCDLTGTDCTGASFIDCEFISCRADEIRMNKAGLQRCVFREHNDESGTYDEGRLESCGFEDCLFSNSNFYSVRFEKTRFEGGKIENAALSGSELRTVEMNNLAIDFCSFNEVTAVGLTFEKCSSRGISFGNADLTALELTDCSEFDYLSLSETTCRGLAITRCESVTEPMIHLSTIENLTITESGVIALDGAESEFTGTGEIKGSRLEGLNLSGSKVKNLTLKNCRILEFLIITGGTFVDLDLQNVEYGDGLRIEADSVTYSNSSKFPES
jgi:uncharacterized protein YjbI with pentapeptide repeats